MKKYKMKEKVNKNKRVRFQKDNLRNVLFPLSYSILLQFLCARADVEHELVERKISILIHVQDSHRKTELPLLAQSHHFFRHNAVLTSVTTS